ncbi:MAG: DUF433 domain-containing protein [Candidatus Lambdaproteobacteria bacterium]|nr:DUF433 domain-containing protein [Candidatus Lambdaproteobacteria bacterium]
MGTDTLLERIAVDPAVLLGKPVIRGTRLSVEHVLGLLAGGWTFDAIQGSYPGLTAEDIRACIAYARRLVEEEKVYPIGA